MKGDPYKVLGVGRDASEAEIKKRFRRVARDLHPDTNPEDDHAEEKFKEAAEAYEILSDPERRSVYDRYGHDGLSSSGFQSSAQGFGSFGDIFDAFFGGGDPFSRFGGGGGGAVQGGDVAVAASITLEQAANGAEVEVEYEAVERCEHCHGNRAEPGTPIETCERCEGTGQLRSVARTAFGQMVRAHPCDVCGGTGERIATPCTECSGRGVRAQRKTLTVEVPAGIADEQRIRLTGRGHAGERGGPNGDLYVVVRVREDERFLRDGEDLITVVDVPAPLAALGTTVEVPTFDGPVPVEVPAGTQPGETILLRGRGMPPLSRGRTGDIRVVVNVATPRRLTRAQRELLERFAETITEDNSRSDEGMLAKLKRVLAG
jgi:molecular chaperone DnaJ